MMHHGCMIQVRNIRASLINVSIESSVVMEVFI